MNCFAEIVLSSVSPSYSFPYEGAALTDMAVFLRSQRAFLLLAVAFFFLPFITSSLHLEDPNVCSHWERLVTML